jgi:outer membrane lipase/esterase
MKIKKRVLPALLLSLFAAASAPEASAAQFSGVYVFGDSLSDAGYFRPFIASLGLPAPIVATLGRFTTNPGPVWSELVSSYYGVTPAPSNVGTGNIFAQGGARVSSTPGVSTPPGQPERPVSAQIDQFLARGPVDSGALYTVWAGANDLFFQLGAFSAGAITAAQLQTNVLAAATSEIGQVARLQAAGARYVAVFALPNVGATPAFAGSPTAATVTALAAGYNTTLFTGLASAGLRVIPVDTFSFFNEVIANPSAYGFTNTTGIACGAFPPITTPTTVTSLFCYSGNLTAPNADRTYVFADSVHPTTATHALVAQFVEAMIEGPSNYGLLTESAMRSRESHIRSLADGIATGRADDVGKFSVFVGGDRSDFKIDSGAGFPGLDTRSNAGTVGITMRASEAVVVGAAYGYSNNDGTFASNGGNYSVAEHIWSVFASMKSGGFYGTGVLSIADLKFDDMKRNIVLGPTIRVAEARTDGSNASAHIAFGYDFPINRFTIGPTVSVTLQDIDVNSFDESGAGTANLRVLEQKRKSEIWSAGLRASYNFGRWTPWARVTADKERRDDVREVSAIPLTMLAINNSYAVPTYKGDNSYVTASIGLNGMITPSVGLSVGYYYVDSRTGTKQDGLNGMVSVRF